MNSYGSLEIYYSTEKHRPQNQMLTLCYVFVKFYFFFLNLRETFDYKI